MLKKILLGVLVVLVVGGVGVLYYFNSVGVFEKITVAEKTMSSMTIVYATHIGSYRSVGPTMMLVADRLEKEFGVKATKGIGIYYDAPGTKPETELKCDVGSILEGKDEVKMAIIMKKMKTRWIGQKSYVVATFPIKNNMSYGIGATKAYPELMKYMKARGYKATPSMEIYDMSAKVITYGFEIKK